MHHTNAFQEPRHPNGHRNTGQFCCGYCRQEACKAAEAEAIKARSSLRQERIDWERADAESRSVLTSLREEWRMLQETNAQLHANVAKVTKSLQVTHVVGNVL